MQITKMLRLTTIVMCVWTYLYIYLLQKKKGSRVGRYGSDIRTPGSFSPPAILEGNHIYPSKKKCW